VIQTVLIGGTHVFLKIGPLEMTLEGMDAAGTVALRTVVLVIAARVFIGTTEPRQLALALAQQWRFPYSAAFSIFFLMRLLPLF